jgi:hypothetical protein
MYIRSIIPTNYQITDNRLSNVELILHPIGQVNNHYPVIPIQNFKGMFTD